MVGIIQLTKDVAVRESQSGGIIRTNTIILGEIFHYYYSFKNNKKREVGIPDQHLKKEKR
jgi:hypothetical protein